MKHMRILIFVLALALLCAGCASGGTAEATPAPDMSDLPLDGGYAYLRVEVLSRDKDAKTLEVRVLDFGDAAGRGRLRRPAVDGHDDRLRRVDHHLHRPRAADVPAAADIDREPGALRRARGEMKKDRLRFFLSRCFCHQNFFFLHTHRLMPTITMLTTTMTG